MEPLKRKANTVLVTGADGFIGSHLVELLAKNGFAVRAFCLYNSNGSSGWLDKIDPNDYSYFHIHQIAEASMGKENGFGTLENLVVGRHDPSGFKDLFDVAK